MLGIIILKGEIKMMGIIFLERKMLGIIFLKMKMLGLIYLKDKNTESNIFKGRKML